MPSVGIPLELRLTLRAVEEGVPLALEGGRPGWDAAPLQDAVSGLAALWHRPGGQDAWEWKAGLPVAHDVTGGERVGVRPGAFTQDKAVAFSVERPAGTRGVVIPRGKSPEGIETTNTQLGYAGLRTAA